MAATLVLFCALPHSGSAKDEVYHDLPKGATLFLPNKSQSEWPLLPGTLMKLDKKKLDFGVAGNEKICLIAGGRVIFYPELQLFLTSKVPIQEFVWLAEGNMLVHSGKELGFLEINEDLKTESPAEKKKGLLHFNPLFTLPYKQSRLFGSYLDSFYIVGRNEKENRNEIIAWNLAADKAPAKPLYATDTEISAVAGSPEKTFFASGRGVFMLEKGKASAKLVYTHAREDIRDLIYRPDVGLFFTTGNGAGYIGEKEQYEFLAYPGVELRLKGKALYVRFGSVANGIMKITGPEHFADLRLDPPNR